MAKFGTPKSHVGVPGRMGFPLSLSLNESTGPFGSWTMRLGRSVIRRSFNEEEPIQGSMNIARRGNGGSINHDQEEHRRGNMIRRPLPYEVRRTHYFFV